jgi:hypothetical protein
MRFDNSGNVFQYKYGNNDSLDAFFCQSGDLDFLIKKEIGQKEIFYLHSIDGLQLEMITEQDKVKGLNFLYGNNAYSNEIKSFLQKDYDKYKNVIMNKNEKEDGLWQRLILTKQKLLKL